MLSASLLLLGVVLGRLSEHANPAVGQGSTAGASVPIATTAYVVQPGDTLWSIARSVQPQGDIRPLVDRLSEQVGDRPLRAGQRLLVPGQAPSGG